MGNVQSTVPFGAQINKINTDLTCHYAGYNGTFNLELSMTAPLQAKTLSYSDIYGKITLDQRLIDGGTFGTYRYLVADASIAIDVSNSSPSSFIIQQHIEETSNIPYLLVNSSATNHALGPFTIDDNAKSQMTLGNVSFSLTYYGAQIGNIAVTCDLKPELISTVVAGKDTSAPSIGSPGFFPPIAAGQKATVINVPVDCTDEYWFQPYPPQPANLSSTLPFNLTVGGIVPLGPTQPFNISGITSFVTVPADLVGAFSYVFPGDSTRLVLQYGKDFNGTDQAGSGFDAQSSNAAAGIDWSRDFVSNIAQSSPLSGYQDIEHSTSTAVTIALPPTGQLSVGPYTAAGDFDVSISGFNGYIDGMSKFSGILDGYANFRCGLNGAMAGFSVRSGADV